MPKISVITPTHSNKWYERARASMLRQSEGDWEWIVLANGDFKLNFDEPDPRIRLIKSKVKSTNVGALKKEACSYASAPYIVEFDHDDELGSDCLEEVLRAFLETPAVFVYSDDARVNEDGSAATFGEAYGWETYTGLFKGEKDEVLVAHTRPALLPQNVSRIIHAPDHVRAWTKEAYDAVGGHDPELSICDDLDLMQKLFIYSGGKFHHIQKILYKYYIHGGNTWLERNKEIQNLWPLMHDARIEEMARAYCKNWCLPVIDLDSCIHEVLQIEETGGRWPYADSSVGLIVSKSSLERVQKPIHFFNEAYRVLKHGGLILIDTPSANGVASISSPLNKSVWCIQSFWNYTKADAQRHIKHLGSDCRFQEVRLREYYPSRFHIEIRSPYVKAHLAAIKDGERLHGLYEI